MTRMQAAALRRRTTRGWAVFALLLCVSCAERTSILVEIDGSRAQVPILAPTDIDHLGVELLLEGSGVWAYSFTLPGAQRALAESLRLNLRDHTDQELELRVRGWLGEEAPRVEGSVSVTAWRGVETTAEVQLKWNVDACVDRDGDGYGALSCLGPDCDDSDPQRFGDADPDCRGGVDAGVTDAGQQDSAAADAGTTDVGATDNGATDSGAADSGAADSGTTDSGATDAGAADSAEPCGEPWWDPAWQFRRKLTLDNSAQDEALQSFPVLLALTPDRIEYGETRPLGEDLRFVDADGVTELPYEIESWQPAAASALWVQVPQVEASSDQDFIWMYYGNPAASAGEAPAQVWDAHYAAVWHLAETEGDYLDSTANGNHSDTVEVSERGVAGAIGGAARFDGVDDVVRVPNSDSLAVDGDQITMEAWIWLEVIPPEEDGYFIFAQKSGGSPYRSYGINVYQQNVTMIAADVTSEGSTFNCTGGEIPLSTQEWLYVAGQMRGVGEPMRVYVNGAHATRWTRGLLSGTITPAESSFYIGADFPTGPELAGYIDEVRVSSAARSLSWMAAQHLSMTDAFVVYGPQQSSSCAAE